MGLIARLEARPRRAAGTDNFMAAEISRLTAGLANDTEYINTTLRHQLRLLRARSRQAAKSNPFARRFINMVVNNVCGPRPFTLQSKVKFNTGRLDTNANKKIEDAWKGWSKRGQCEVTGRFSRNAYLRLIVRTLATDGEVLLRKYAGEQYGDYGYQYQLIDIDRLDETKNESFRDGGAIHMGVELDAMSRPVAYHVLKRKPSQWHLGGYTREYERIAAREIEHLFIPDYAEQVRGAPWMYAALINLVHLGAFEEAAVIAARVGASQMGFIQTPEGGQDVPSDGKDEKGNPRIDAEPGTFPFLPEGYQIAGWNPKYPDAAVEPFIKACLRGIASGLDVAYHNLASDLEGVNYSSARIGELDERDAWMSIQDFMIEHHCQPGFEEWLHMQMLLGNVDLVPGRIERYQAVHWQPRRWQWVDPMKEVGANIAAINNKIKSRTRVVAEQGEDIEDVFEELSQEAELAKEKKIDLTPVPVAKPGGDKPAKPPANDDEDNADAQSSDD
jgi:lambda family phage portal protein